MKGSMLGSCYVLYISEAEHGYASVLPFYSKGDSDKRKKQKTKSLSPGNSR